MVSRIWSMLALMAALYTMPQAARCEAPAEALDFARDVRPILSQHCFKCHGPDAGARQAQLRLDLRDSAIGEAESGLPAVVPSKPDESELVRRITSTDPDEVMPPPATKNPLSEAKRNMLRRWIAEGAAYKAHWAFAAPRQAPLPPVAAADWPTGAIDRFVLARHQREGLRPSPAADRYTLIRRLYLDLVGLAPTPEAADAFARDAAPDAYEKLVDSLLASPHYGERWARHWLDLARYADTNGYEKDRPRSIWPYRDWVIRAINDDMPFDQFTIEQLAGDMLPGATFEQRVATGFHRNTMLNEEGGIDPLEFRFHAMTDRMATTGATWLGLTIGCAQCHTHKYDPLTHREYYQLMALLNNCDEPQFEVPDAAVSARRSEVEAQIAARQRDLAARYPLENGVHWHSPRPDSVAVESGASAEILDDASVRISGATPERDVYTVVLRAPADKATMLRVEAMTDPALPSGGPGRTAHGNFVLTELSVSVAAADAPAAFGPMKLARASADFSQDGFPPQNAIDGNPQTGWAIHGPAPWNVTRTATFALDKPPGTADALWTIRLAQDYGSQHSIGRFRISIGRPVDDSRPVEIRRRERLDRDFGDWLARESPRARNWTILRPAELSANVPILAALDDGSVLASGDTSKRDEYRLVFRDVPRKITAVRLEALTDDRLPGRGPGRVYYEGAQGDFFMTQFRLAAGDKPVALASASQSFADGNHKAAGAIDEDAQTGWAINGGQGRAHSAVFVLAAPLEQADSLALTMVCERYFASALGRFRISVTADEQPASANSWPADVEALLAMPDAERTARERQQLLDYFLSIAPALAEERAAIKALRDQLPPQPTTLVMSERPPQFARTTHIHKRGEFLQPTDKVSGGVPEFLPPLPAGALHDRLALARWLVSKENPLTARVTVNRHWAALFGRGLVRTTEDFGIQGEPPTHPELLDWLAVQFMNDGWSIKRLHRLIVTSATYRQSSRLTPDMLQRDPQNRWLARAPRFRVEAEAVRDLVLSASGLLVTRMGGPSVFPPQPAGVSSEGAYGPLAWNVSPGGERYRRGLYTFAKRTTPFAMLNTFDAPSGEACVTRREMSNTALQALALLNDQVILDAARALGRAAATTAGTDETRAAYILQRCLSRPATTEELALVVAFYQAQKERLSKGELDAKKIAGAAAANVVERAAWTIASRAVLNLEETITRQ